MILDIYKDSFEFSSKKITSLLLLGVLYFFNFLIIPLIFFYGYNYRVIKLSTQSMINGEDEPPEFTDFKKMFIDGLKYIVVYLVYAIIPIILFILGTVYNNGILFVIGIILLIICVLFAYLAVANMAASDDSLGSAFSFGQINEIMASIGYGRYILAYLGIVVISAIIVIVVVLVLALILGALGIATSSVLSTNGLAAVSTIGSLIMTFVLSFIVMPFVSLFQSRCAGLIYNLGS